MLPALRPRRRFDYTEFFQINSELELGNDRSLDYDNNARLAKKNEFDEERYYEYLNSRSSYIMYNGTKYKEDGIITDESFYIFF
jgi:hypothetical protein